MTDSLPTTEPARGQALSALVVASVTFVVSLVFWFSMWVMLVMGLAATGRLEPEAASRQATIIIVLIGVLVACPVAQLVCTIVGWRFFATARYRRAIRWALPVLFITLGAGVALAGFFAWAYFFG